MDQNAKIIAKIVRPNGEPLPEGTQVTVFDEDWFTDDNMGTTKLSEHGKLELLFHMSAMRGIDSLFETKPDLYVVVDSGEFAGYRSTTIDQVEILREDPVTGFTYATRDLGSITVYPAE